MRPAKISWLSILRASLKHKLKPYIVDGKYKISPAFEIGNVTYWQYDDSKEVPSGRFFAAMGIYTEMEMNCSKDYLQSHIRAMEKVLSNPKSIRIDYIMQMNVNLKERVEMLMPFEDYIYKLASVVFFDKSESLYSYDYEYNKLKIERWKAAGGALDFFSKTYLAELVPSLSMPEKDTQTYLTVTRAIEEIHRRLHFDILSAEV